MRMRQYGRQTHPGPRCLRRLLGGRWTSEPPGGRWSPFADHLSVAAARLAPTGAAAVRARSHVPSPFSIPTTAHDQAPPGHLCTRRFASEGPAVGASSLPAPAARRSSPLAAAEPGSLCARMDTGPDPERPVLLDAGEPKTHASRAAIRRRRSSCHLVADPVTAVRPLGPVQQPEPLVVAEGIGRYSDPLRQDADRFAHEQP
jgi:hypothetical protein